MTTTNSATAAVPSLGASIEATVQIDRLNRAGRRLSRNDVKIVLMSRLLAAPSRHEPAGEALDYLCHPGGSIDTVIERLHGRQEVSKVALGDAASDLQRSLF